MSDDYFYFDAESLHARADALAEGYKTAAPFPHAVIDNLMPDDIALRLAREFPARDFAGFQSRDNPHQVFKQSRLQESYFKGVSGFARHMVLLFNDHVFIDFLEKLTGIPNLLPDPRLLGGGTHQTLPGGLLRIHADFNKHRIYDLDRRLNLLLYLNDDWHDEYGGHLELWDRELTACQKRVLPISKRMVIFSTCSDTWHGHPHALTCPAGRARQSLALYYYTNGRPADETHPKHKTLWPLLPGEQLPI